MDPFIDTQTGEEIGEIPVTHIRFNKSEADAFKVFVQRTGRLLASLRARQNGWECLAVSLGFFIKAFFTEGLAQMLRHITTMEAILGDKEPGFTKRLAQRIALILGKDENERKTIRDLARRTLLWFLHCLSHLLAQIPDDKRPVAVPTREDILALLDLNENNRIRLSRLIGSLPAGFPYVGEWSGLDFIPSN